MSSSAGYSWLAPDLVITGEAVALEVRPASVGVRVLGGLVDALALLVGAGLLLVALDPVLASLNEAQATTVAVVMVAAVTVVVPTLVETVTRGRSLGKLATGVRIVRDDGGPVRFRHALVRSLVGLGELWFTAGSVAIVTAILNRRGKRLGDLLAGTYAVRVRNGARRKPPLLMPPELEGWARGADVRALPDGVGLAARRFLARTGTMTPAARAQMGGELAALVEPYVSPPPPWGTHPERFLAAVLAARRDREYDLGLRALEREAAEQDRVRRLPHGIPEP